MKTKSLSHLRDQLSKLFLVLTLAAFTMQANAGSSLIKQIDDIAGEAAEQAGKQLDGAPALPSAPPKVAKPNNATPAPQVVPPKPTRPVGKPFITNTQPGQAIPPKPTRPIGPKPTAVDASTATTTATTNKPKRALPTPPVKTPVKPKAELTPVAKTTPLDNSGSNRPLPSAPVEGKATQATTKQNVIYEQFPAPTTNPNNNTATTLTPVAKTTPLDTATTTAAAPPIKPGRFGKLPVAPQAKPNRIGVVPGPPVAGKPKPIGAVSSTASTAVLKAKGLHQLGPSRIPGNGKLAINDVKMNATSDKVYSRALYNNVDLTEHQVQLAKAHSAFDADSAGQILLEGAPLGDGIVLGKQVGGGSVSKVYLLKGDETKVVKVVPLRVTPRGFDGNEQILDQAIGRKILNDLKTKSWNSDVFEVAEQNQLRIVRTDSGELLAASIEKNISTPVFDPVKRAIKQNSDGSFKFASNAAERLEKLGVKQLTAKEELTVNLAIRELNFRGIVWADNKLENFDVVPDLSSKTGYKVIFFDLDGFRPVRGNTADDRVALARDLQKAMDLNDGGVNYNNSINNILTKYHSSLKAFRQDDLFDYTAFKKIIPPAQTPNINGSRFQMAYLNDLDNTNFNNALLSEIGSTP